MTVQERNPETGRGSPRRSTIPPSDPLSDDHALLSLRKPWSGSFHLIGDSLTLAAFAVFVIVLLDAGALLGGIL